MKYLKTFENNSELKKYLLLKIIDEKGNMFLIICEVIEFLNDVRYRYNLSRLYKIDKEGFRKLNSDTIKISNKFLKKHLVRQSDNLEELINIIEPMFHSEKFNI